MHLVYSYHIAVESEREGRGGGGERGGEGGEGEGGERLERKRKKRREERGEEGTHSWLKQKHIQWNLSNTDTTGTK